MPKTYEPIATTTLGSAAADVTFSSITGSYTDLRMVFNGTSTASNPALGIQINGETGAYYSRTFLNGNGTSAASGRSSNATILNTIRLQTSQTTVTWDFMNYSNTTTFKTILSAGANAANEVIRHVFLFRGVGGSSTAAITSIKIISESPNTFATGSTFTLYGIKAA
jgi:hypothetical protein